MTFASRAHNTKRETISRLLAMAEREFGAKGLEGARVDDIARAAGVTKQLVYNYYRSKDEIFESLLDEASAQAMSEMVELELDSLPPPQALREFLSFHFEQYRRYPLLGLTAMEENRRHGIHISSRNKFPELMPLLVAETRACARTRRRQRRFQKRNRCGRIFGDRRTGHGRLLRQWPLPIGDDGHRSLNGGRNDRLARPCR